MKIIMTLIVTMAIFSLALQASNTELHKGFTVTHIALDAEKEKERIITQALVEIADDSNITTQGGKTEKD